MSDDQRNLSALPLSKVIELGRRSLDLVGDGDWTPQDAALSMLIVAAERESRTTYPATPVDCLISELREMFGWDGSQEMTLADFEARVLQFKEEIGGV